MVLAVRGCTGVGDGAGLGVGTAGGGVGVGTAVRSRWSNGLAEIGVKLPALITKNNSPETSFRWFTICRYAAWPLSKVDRLATIKVRSSRGA